MPLLIFVTLLWAFSFSLIGVYLSGKVDPYFSVLLRIGLASLVFLPLIRWRTLRLGWALRLAGIGAVQLGLMYIFYYNAFELLTVPEVLIFTVTTPIFITLLDDLFHRRFSLHYLLVALLAVLGAAVIRFDGVSGSFLLGFLVVQGSNLCFAFGQVAYRRLDEVEQSGQPAHATFGFFYFGALVVALLAWLTLGSPNYPTEAGQWGVLLWLGLGASGLGYFLWNRGATQVDPGTLAVMNNVLIPAGLLVNLTIWNKEADLLRLALGSAILLAALWLNRRRRRGA